MKELIKELLTLATRLMKIFCAFTLIYLCFCFGGMSRVESDGKFATIAGLVCGFAALYIVADDKKN